MYNDLITLCQGIGKSYVNCKLRHRLCHEPSLIFLFLLKHGFVQLLHTIPANRFVYKTRRVATDVRALSAHTRGCSRARSAAHAASLQPHCLLAFHNRGFVLHHAFSPFGCIGQTELNSGRYYTIGPPPKASFLEIELLVGTVRFASGKRGRLNSSGFFTLYILTSQCSVV